MKGKEIWMAALAILLCISLRALQIQGDQWNKKTILTVKETIQIPGATLTPGRYVFRLHDSSSNRHIVQVFNEQENHVLTTVLAIPNYRLKPTGDSEFGFWEMPQGSPPALRSWFYPGDNFGQEFAYPKSEATQLAAVTHQNVPSLSDEEQATFNQEAKSTPAAEPQPEQPRSEVSSEPRPVEPSTTAQVTPREYPKAPSTVSSADQTRTPTPVHTAVPAKLPGTASSLPLIGLLGCGSLVVGSVFRRLRSSR